MQSKTIDGRRELLNACLNAFVKAGTLDLSLDQLAGRVGTSKRMLIHYFGSREDIEEGAITLLEENLRAQFAPESFPADATAQAILTALWKRTTLAEAKGVLLLVMDVSRRAWNGSTRAKRFYLEQQRLWVRLVLRVLHKQALAEDFLQLFQGAVLAYLITGDPEPGKRSIDRFLARQRHKTHDA